MSIIIMRIIIILTVNTYHIKLNLKWLITISVQVKSITFKEENKIIFL